MFQGISKIFNDNSPNHKRKNDVSLSLWHEVNFKTIEYFMFDKNKNRGIIQNPVRTRKKYRLSIFELN